jgi:hypothetical protein
MKKLFSMILVICSLLGGNAYAEVITLDCKFISGIEYNDKYQTEKKLFNEINKVVILDSKKEKIIEADYHYGGDDYFDGYSGWDTGRTHGRDSPWSETRIRWQNFSYADINRKTMISTYSAEINRVSGQMKTSLFFKLPGKNDYYLVTENMYQCSKKDKLF